MKSHLFFAADNSHASDITRKTIKMHAHNFTPRNVTDYYFE